MQRYMIYLKNTFHTPKDAPSLLKTVIELVGDPNVTVRDTRVSTKMIEFDVSIPDQKRVHDIIQKMEGISPLAEYESVTEKHMEKSDAIKHARQLFNEEKFWGTHEILESVWKSSAGEEKNLLNGIILVAAAFVHEQKNEHEICISILKRALAKFDASKKYVPYHGIDVNRFILRISKIIKTGNVERFTI